MGALVSRWRTKPTTVEVLERLDKDIQTFEEHKEKNQKQLKLWVYRLLLYSTFLYLLACAVVYMWYIPRQLMGKLVLASSFLIFPLLIWLLRKLLIMLYSRRTERNVEKLEELKAKKKKILEQVMETETYKNAKLILERFDPDSKKRLELDATPVKPLVTTQQGQELRQRHVAHRPPVPMTPNPAVAVRPATGSTAPPALISAPGGPPEPGTSRNLSASAQHHNLLRRNVTPTSSPSQGVGIHPPGPPLARPVLPRDRGSMDKLIEYLVGDGPKNRYALICQQCLSHNGMALKEEFEYVAFRCAYCYFLNPARKTRPQAPHLHEISEIKTGLEPASVALVTDQCAPTTSTEDVCESSGSVEEKTSEHQEENQPETPGPLEPASTLSDRPEKSDHEQDPSAMEVE